MFIHQHDGHSGVNMLFHAAHDRADERQEPNSVESLLRGLEAFAPFNIGYHCQAALPANHVV